MGIEGPRSSLQHRQRFASSFFACTFREETAEPLPTRIGISKPTSGGLIFKVHDRDVVVGTALGTDATADAAFGDVDLSTG